MIKLRGRVCEVEKLNFSKKETIWLVVFLGIMLAISFVWKESWLSVFATVTGILCVVLVAKGNIYNYFFGIMNVVAYAIVSYRAGYGGDFVLNAFYYLPIQFIGYYTWKKNYNKEQTHVEVNTFKPIYYVYSGVALVIGTLSIRSIMPIINSVLGMPSNPLPLIDSFTTFASIFAQILMVKRYREQWILWIIVNIFSIFMWLKLGDYVMVIMWSAYLVNAIYGYINWGKIKED